MLRILPEVGTRLPKKDIAQASLLASLASVSFFVMVAPKRQQTLVAVINLSFVAAMLAKHTVIQLSAIAATR